MCDLAILSLSGNETNRYDLSNGGASCTLQGDYLLPDIKLAKQERGEIGV